MATVIVAIRRNGTISLADQPHGGRSYVRFRVGYIDLLPARMTQPLSPFTPLGSRKRTLSRRPARSSWRNGRFSSDGELSGEELRWRGSVVCSVASQLESTRQRRYFRYVGERMAHVDIVVLVESILLRALRSVVRISSGVVGRSKRSAVVIHAMLEMRLEFLQRCVRRFDRRPQLEGMGDQLNVGRGDLLLRREGIVMSWGRGDESGELGMER